MSVDVISNKGLSEEFPTHLSNNERGKLYGELIVTEHRKAVLRCCVCNIEHRFYKKFLKHIFQHYDELQKLLHPVEEDPLGNIDVEVHENKIDLDINISGTVLTTTVVSIEEEALSAPAESKNSPSEKHIEAEQVEGDLTVEADKAQQERVSEDADTTKAVETHPFAEKDNEDSTSSESEDNLLVPLQFPSPPPVKRICKPKKNKKTSDKAEEQHHNCDICGKTFTKAKYLKIHRRRHLDDGSFPCSTCQKKFHSRRDLEIHMRRQHTGECPFICKYCGAGFPVADYRNRHEKRHVVRMNNIRPNKCKLCEKSFFEAEKLTKHMVTHTRERKFICTECNSGFIHKRNLNVHMKIHKNAREYVCNICGFGFNQSAARYLHMRNTHKVITGCNAKSGKTIAATDTEK